MGRIYDLERSKRMNTTEQIERFKAEIEILQYRIQELELKIKELEKKPIVYSELDEF
jgi:predicted RNase H-like nuclease (RuvC/YqgF family)